MAGFRSLLAVRSPTHLLPSWSLWPDSLSFRHLLDTFARLLGWRGTCVLRSWGSKGFPPLSVLSDILSAAWTRPFPSQQLLRQAGVAPQTPGRHSCLRQQQRASPPPALAQCITLWKGLCIQVAWGLGVAETAFLRLAWIHPAAPFLSALSRSACGG